MLDGAETEDMQSRFELKCVLEGHENEVKCVAWSSDGCILATCSRDKSIWLWQVGEELGTVGEIDCLEVL